MKDRLVLADGALLIVLNGIEIPDRREGGGRNP